MKTFRMMLVAVVITPSLFARLTPTYEAWGETAVRYLMMKSEKTEWAALKTDEDAKAFIERFWARRDPTPRTPENELRHDFEARIAEADKRYKFGSTPGSQTDYGLVYVLLGQPTQIAGAVAAPARNPYNMGQFNRPINIQTWIYRSADAQRVTGTNAFDIAFVFHDEKNAANFELDGPSKQAFESTALTVAKMVLKQPALTSDATRTVALAMIVVNDRNVANDVLRRAQEGEDFAALAKKFSLHPSAQQGGYLGKLAFADLDDDIRNALAGKQPGESAMITRKPQFAIIHILTDAEVH